MALITLHYEGDEHKLLAAYHGDRPDCRKTIAKLLREFRRQKRQCVRALPGNRNSSMLEWWVYQKMHNNNLDGWTEPTILRLWSVDCLGVGPSGGGAGVWA